MLEVWATTYDNPYDPFTQGDQWLKFDVQSGYNTCERIARLVPYDETQLSDDTLRILINDAVEDLCELFYPYKVYRPVIKGKTQPW